MKVELDTRITSSLWIEGRYNEIKHWYMQLRKKKGLNRKDNFLKLLYKTKKQ